MEWTDLAAGCSCFRMPSLKKKGASPRDHVVGYAIPAMVLVEIVMKGKQPCALCNNPLVSSEVNCVFFFLLSSLET